MFKPKSKQDEYELKQIKELLKKQVIQQEENIPRTAITIPSNEVVYDFEYGGYRNL